MVDAPEPVVWVLPKDGACPDGYPVKAKVTSRIYHVPGGTSYARTSPDRCYATPADAEADGFRAAKR
jgi:micrococcal nuclease